MLVQTSETCWLYTILNGFLLSNNGQKLLYKHLLAVERSMTAAERAYFYSAASPACPGSNLKRINKMFFWKFFDRYVCALGGPRNAALAPRKSANLLMHVASISPTKRHGLQWKGGVGIEEIPKILRNIGVTDFSVVKRTGNALEGRPTDELVIVDGNVLPYDIERTLFRGRSRAPYDLAYASIIIGNTATAKFHAVCAYMVYDQGYIFDSNFGGRVYKVNWLKPKTLYKAAIAISNEYNILKNKLDFVTIDYLVYTNRRMLQSVAPACRRPDFSKVRSVLNKAPTKSAVSVAVRNMRNSGYLIPDANLKKYLNNRFPVPLARKLFN
jgi:hypothetical protein